MLQHVALPLCLAFIIWVWRYDQRRNPDRSPALWIPTLWFLALGSHPLSFWLGLSGGGSDLDGNPFDMAIYIVEIWISIVILGRRGIRWGQFIEANKCIFLFYAFLLITLLWAPFPFVVVKRWCKDIGAIPIILLILSDEDPLAAAEAVFLRCAYVLLPLSVVFCKYIPALGRSYSNSGAPDYHGVAGQKNSLGEIVLIFGLFIVLRLLQLRDSGRFRWSSPEVRLLGIILCAGLWLLQLCDSKTAILCLLIGVVILLTYKLPVFKSSPSTALILLLGLVLAGGTLQLLFDVKGQLLALMGRDATLTDRTDIWHAVLEHPVDPMVGTGYMMYWDTYKITVQGHELTLRTAHNGYLEVYLDGGWIGIVLLGVMLFPLGIRTARAFLTGTPIGRLRFAFFVVMLIYNVSESMYGRRSPLWFTFLLFCVDLPEGAFARSVTPALAAPDLDEREGSLESAGVP